MASAPARSLHCPARLTTNRCCTRCSTMFTMNSAFPSVRPWTKAAMGAAIGPPAGHIRRHLLGGQEIQAQFHRLPPAAQLLDHSA
jgi:hypothetical protein